MQDRTVVALAQAFGVRARSFGGVVSVAFGSVTPPP
jgi:hypothetical protein